MKTRKSCKMLCGLIPGRSPYWWVFLLGLLQHPDVPLTQLEQTLTAMAERYAAAGESMAPVLRARFLLALQVSGPERAKAEFGAWIAATRTVL